VKAGALPDYNRFRNRNAVHRRSQIFGGIVLCLHLAGVLAGLAGASALATLPRTVRASAAACPFRLSVINDEISADFDHACSVAANDFGLQWIEIRSMWNKNVTELNADEIDRARQIWKNTSCASLTSPARF